MCGIFGILRLEESVDSINIDLARSAMLKMKHRGPDFQAISQPDEYLLLGHLRLAIVDLNENNNQPFVDAEYRYHLVYNGEIYNYIELRSQLCEKGYSFRTEGDVEVVLNSFIEWGEDCVSYFNGMWAFAIYDSQEKTLFCSRDRFGVKPFCYALHDGYFIFASEIKSIITYFTKLKTPNYNIISNFCRKSLVLQQEETWFSGVKRLMPAHNLIIGNNGGIAIERYWQYPTEQLDISFDEAKSRYFDLFEDAVKLRMRSDVKVGTSLSGGVDSPSIVAALRKFYSGEHHTFTAFSQEDQYYENDKVAFRGNVNVSEVEIVRNLNSKFGLEGHLIEVNYSNYTEQLQHLIYHMEAAHPFTTVVPLSQLYAIAKEEITVILEGQGADELLGGYMPQVLVYYLWDLMKSAKFSAIFTEVLLFRKHYSLRFAILSFIRTLNSSFLQKFYGMFSGTNSLYKGKLKNYTFLKDNPSFSPEFNNKLNKILHDQHCGGLVNLLHYGDALSMEQSMESRMPFMDYRLVEFVFQLPAQYKIRGAVGKYIHREALRNLMENKHEDFFSPLKIGFHSPMTALFLSDEPNSPSQILLSKRCLERGLFDEKSIRQLISAQRKGKGQGALLYRLLGVELWFREWID
ncbi:MAG: asparagine synthase (glutamine-hydrolyzing) [Saprospiraceae bacterium]